MKKKIAVLLVTIMMMTMSISCFAAESPTTDTTETTDSTATEYDNVTIITGEVKVNGMVVGEVPEMKPVNKSKVDEAQKEAKDKVASTAKVLQIVEVNINTNPFIENVIDIVGIDLRTEDYDTITIPFHVDGVVKGQKLILLVQKTDGTWVTVTPDKVENGKVIATFDFEFTNVAFVAYNASAQTGEVMSVLPVVMAVSVAAMVFCGKKVKYSR